MSAGRPTEHRTTEHLTLVAAPPDGADSETRDRAKARPRPSLLLAEDVAAMVGMTKEWVYAETRAGRIPHVTLGRYYRYRPESIEAWLCEVERRSSGASWRRAGAR